MVRYSLKFMNCFIKYKGPSINDVTPNFKFLDHPPSPCHPMSPMALLPLEVTSPQTQLNPPPFFSKILFLILTLLQTRKYPLRGYILGSGAPGPQGSTPKTYGATFISELRHLELLMGWNAEVWRTNAAERTPDGRTDVKVEIVV